MGNLIFLPIRISIKQIIKRLSREKINMDNGLILLVISGTKFTIKNVINMINPEDRIVP
ncbi:hypothetical protein GCM10022393_22900 [Aquimarina addita]|uniref:Uncharacterized protein n=1 Tax=Aquimarina addita TaxID=870485 RepID=A0ABP6UJF2_9FLAO